MDALPYYGTFAVLCFILSFGLQKRPAWMWYLGWAIIYLFAARFGSFFFGALYLARDGYQELFAFIYLIGGLIVWIPAAVWWGTHRHLFGQRKKAAAPVKPPGNP